MKRIAGNILPKKIYEWTKEREKAQTNLEDTRTLTYIKATEINTKQEKNVQSSVSINSSVYKKIV